MLALKKFEDTHVLPLVRGIKAKPIRDQAHITMGPGDLAFLMNNAEDPEVTPGNLVWHPLLVMYTDRDGLTDWVFRFTAKLPATAQEPLLTSAEIFGVVKLVHGDGEVLWVDPVTDTVFLSFPMAESNKILSNAWFLFRGAILPMLYERSFTFPEPIEARVFQANVVHKIVAVYKELL